MRDRAVLATPPAAGCAFLPAYAQELDPVEYVWNDLTIKPLAHLTASDAQTLPVIPAAAGDLPLHRPEGYQAGSRLLLAALVVLTSPTPAVSAPITSWDRPRRPTPGTSTSRLP
jgi:hypothetical protein